MPGAEGLGGSFYMKDPSSLSLLGMTGGEAPRDDRRRGFGSKFRVQGSHLSTKLQITNNNKISMTKMSNPRERPVVVLFAYRDDGI